MINDLGFFTALLIGLSLGFCGYAILLFWVQLFFKEFDDTSKWYWRLFYAHMAIWVAVALFVPIDFWEDTFYVWGKPCFIFFIVSIVVMAIAKIRSMK